MSGVFLEAANSRFFADDTGHVGGNHIHPGIDGIADQRIPEAAAVGDALGQAVGDRAVDRLPDLLAHAQ
ncbi:hypothetical protein FQZ97_1117630 [compost metagenome]